MKIAASILSIALAVCTLSQTSVTVCQLENSGDYVGKKVTTTGTIINVRTPHSKGGTFELESGNCSVIVFYEGTLGARTGNSVRVTGTWEDMDIGVALIADGVELLK